jgi:hypothetical protein
MARLPNPIVGAIAGWAGRLRFPVLFAVVAALFVADLIVPDLLPFADELLLAMLTVLFATWRKKRRPEPDEAGDGDDGEPGATAGT